MSGRPKRAQDRRLLDLPECAVFPVGFDPAAIALTRRFLSPWPNQDVRRLSELAEVARPRRGSAEVLRKASPRAGERGATPRQTARNFRGARAFRQAIGTGERVAFGLRMARRRVEAMRQPGDSNAPFEHQRSTAGRPVVDRRRDRLARVGRERVEASAGEGAAPQHDPRTARSVLGVLVGRRDPAGPIARRRRTAIPDGDGSRHGRRARVATAGARGNDDGESDRGDGPTDTMTDLTRGDN